MGKASGSGMMRYSPELGARLEKQIVAKGYPAEKRSMFGHQTWFLNGYMFAGANQDGIWVNLGEQEVRRALAEVRGTAPFSPGRGMVMKDYLLLGAEIHGQEASLGRWLDSSSRHLLSLPPKKKGGKR